MKAGVRLRSYLAVGVPGAFFLLWLLPAPLPASPWTLDIIWEETEREQEMNRRSDRWQKRNSIFSLTKCRRKEAGQPLLLMLDLKWNDEVKVLNFSLKGTSLFPSFRRMQQVSDCKHTDKEIDDFSVGWKGVKFLFDQARGWSWLLYRPDKASPTDVCESNITFDYFM